MDLFLYDGGLRHERVEPVGPIHLKSCVNQYNKLKH